MSYQSEKLQALTTTIQRFAPSDGIHAVFEPNVGVFKISSPHGKCSDSYEPAMIIVAQGRKCCYIGEEAFSYGEGHCLISFLPMPVEVELIEASEAHPFLAAGIRIDLARMTDLLAQIERLHGPLDRPPETKPTGIFSTPLTDKLLDPVIRLFEAAQNPAEAEIIGQLCIDELYYRILSDERSGDLRVFLQHRGPIERISKAVQYIQENVSEKVSVDQLAGLVHMSRTSFHENFKDVMHVSPLQYAKSVKLMKAHSLLHEGKNASEAGYLVGYSSPAQFSREYKRHFGYPPSQVVVQTASM